MKYTYCTYLYLFLFLFASNRQVRLVAMDESNLQIVLFPHFTAPKDRDFIDLRCTLDLTLRQQFTVASKPSATDKHNAKQDYSFLDPENICAVDPTIKIVEEFPTHVRPGVCFDYAMMKTLEQYGITGSFDGTGNNDWFGIFSYFKHARNYKKDDLVVYFFQYSYMQDVQHFALLAGPYVGSSADAKTMRVRSKWATLKGVFEHNLFGIPFYWGDHVSVLRLQKAYRTPGPEQDKLLECIAMIGKKAQLCPVLQINKEDLIYYVNHRRNQEAIQLLEQFRTFSIDTTDDTGKTLLMLAVSTDNVPLVDALLNYGASKDVTDNFGQTVYDIARQRNNAEVMNLLHMDCIAACGSKQSHMVIGVAIMTAIVFYAWLKGS